VNLDSIKTLSMHMYTYIDNTKWTYLYFTTSFETVTQWSLNRGTKIQAYTYVR